MCNFAVDKCYKIVIMKRLLTTLFALLVLHAFNARALSFEVDGLKYTVNSDNTTVTVSGKASSSIVDVVIPEYVNYEGVKYTITDIASRAFSGYNL